MHCDIQERKLENEKANPHLIGSVCPVPVPLYAICDQKGQVLDTKDTRPSMVLIPTISALTYPENLGPEYRAYALSQRLAIPDIYLTEQICPD